MVDPENGSQAASDEDSKISLYTKNTDENKKKLSWKDILDLFVNILNIYKI